MLMDIYPARANNMFKPMIPMTCHTDADGIFSYGWYIPVAIDGDNDNKEGLNDTGRPGLIEGENRQSRL